MKKKKSDNRLLCYIGLFFLVVFLLLPPALRWFGKNLYVKEKVKKDEVLVLSCNKTGEKLDSSFLNGEPQNIKYTVKGNHSTTINKEEENTGDTNTQVTSKNNLMELISPYAKIEYDQEENKTIFSVKVSDLKVLENYTPLFSSVSNQEEYFSSQAFYCEKRVY